MTTDDPFEGAASVAEAVDALRASGTEQVRIGLFDTDTILREKAVGRTKAEHLIQDGYSFCDVLYKWDIGEKLYGGGVYADEAAEIDPASGRVYPFAADTALFLADFTGRSQALSPRHLARTQIERAAALGYGIRVGFEYEFFLFEETPESLRDKGYRNLRSAAAGNWTYSALTMAEEGEFLAGMAAVLARAGIELDSLHTELGPGCIEAPIYARQGLRGADDAALFKTFVKAYGLRHQRIVSFMAKWSNDWPGQSGHMHLSLYDLATGEPVFASTDGVPNQVMRRFIGGVVGDMPELLAMTAHTANAYRRLAPGAWAPIHSSWGVQNRSVALRIIEGAAARVEYRVPAADSNPYLTLAACLGSGLTGIERGTEPPPESTGDAYDETVEPARRFPRTLLEAADRIRASDRARALFGDAFVDGFADSREWEDRVFRAHVGDLDRKRYLGVV